MKTQISRDSFDITRKYSGVYLQQGRMIIDADLNELSDLVRARLEGALADAVGSGAPREGALLIAKSGTSFVIQPGRLYTEGVPTRLDAAAPIALTAQLDYRNPPALPANDFHIYADVWERPISALEDSALQDAGLHGADTATRTKTMLQVKWRNRTLDPLEPANPDARIGNALLTLKLRLITAGADPCDPCAAEVVVDERIGNYLFRVEVHDVFTTAGQMHVVLKWSRDNGAEAYPADVFPADFDAAGAWVWEFFDTDSENLLGRHFPASQRRRRGEIRTTFTKPAAPLPNAFVRQWDGYAEINLTTGALVVGHDRGVDLATTRADTDHAYVKIDTGARTVLMNLELLELTLGYGDKTLLTGDYWQAPVREAVDKSGDVVLGKDGAEPPRGILHHYIGLADVDGSGSLVAFNDAFRRRMSFPPLTDLHAGDVGFDNNCNGLYGTAANVQQALDALCGLGAEHIGYTVPGCGSATAPSVATLLAALPGFPDRDAVAKSPSVKDILDYLLCDLNAARLPYDPIPRAARWKDINEGGAAPLTVQQALDKLVTNLDAGDISANVPACVGTATSSKTLQELLALPGGSQSVLEWLRRLYCDVRATHIPLDRSKLLCADLATDATVVSVQDALDKLCQHAGAGCEVTVRVGELEQRLRDFGASQIADIALCLLPGIHVIAAAISISGKRSMRIKGAPGASTISFSGASNLLSASAIVLEDLAIKLATAGQLQLDGSDVASVRCQYARGGGSVTAVPGVRIGSNVLRLQWQHNGMIDTWFDPKPEFVDFTDLEIVNDVRVVNAFRRVIDDVQVLTDPMKLGAAVNEIAAAVAAMPYSDRKRWAAIISARPPAPAVAAGLAAGSDGVRSSPTAKSTSKKTKTAAKTTAKTAAAAPVKVASDVAPAQAVRASRMRIASLVTDQGIIGGTGIAVIVDQSAGAVAGTSTAFADAIAVASPTIEDIRATVIGGLLDFAFFTGINVALALSSHRTHATLSGNEINGEVLLMNQLEATGIDAGVDAAKDIRPISSSLDLVPLGGAQLTLDGNRLDRLWSLVPSLPLGQQLNTPLNGFAACTLQGNHIMDLRNAVVARKLAMHANHFDGVPSEDFNYLGHMLVRVFAAVGNTSTDSSGTIVMLSSADARATSNYFTIVRV